jgi:hypothetical protein
VQAASRAYAALYNEVNAAKNSAETVSCPVTEASTMLNRPYVSLPASVILLACVFPGGEMAEAQATVDSTSELSSLLHEIIIAHLPHEYENTKQWGGTKEVWDGLHISVDGLRVKTKRRTKLANHGTWKRYNVRLVDPEMNLKIYVTNVGRTQDERAAFDLIVRAKLAAFGRLSEWNRDVQLISVSVDAQADVTLTMRCEMGFDLDFQHWPPDVRIEPVVREADLALDSFRLQRISDVHGPLVRELGQNLHAVLQHELDQRRNLLAVKLNRQIDKHRGRLRFSIRDLLDLDLSRLVERPH